jgi:PAS domain S-box-containing protein
MRTAVVLALCAVQAALICILLIERRKRLRTHTANIRNIEEKQRNENQLVESLLFIERMAEAMPCVLFVYDLIERRNVYVNRRSALVIGYSAEEVVEMGDAFLTKLLHPDDLASLAQLNQAYKDRPSGSVFENVFRLKHKNGDWRWVHRCATVLATTPEGQPRQLIGTATDITDLVRTQDELEQLSSRLASVLEVERCRIALDLHDTTAQNLFAMKMNLANIKKDSNGLPEKVRDALEECQQLCEQSLQEVRSLSYLLHPPRLEQLGFEAALRWYIERLNERGGVHAELEISGLKDRLPLDIETALFHVAQEALVNVVRHSRAKRAVVRFDIQDHHAVLQVVDFGRGMRNASAAAAVVIDGEQGPGVGIRSMQQRAQKAGGALEILSGDNGTTVTATIPLAGS